MIAEYWVEICCGALIVAAMAWAILVRPGGSPYPHWAPEDLPLLLTYRHGVPRPILVVFCERAGQINAICGASVFDAWPIPDEEAHPKAPKVLILPPVVMPGEGGRTHLECDKKTGRILRCEVQIAGGNSHGQVISQVGHELGHALGLEHADHPSSIMWPGAWAARAKAYSWADVCALRARYGSGASRGSGSKRARHRTRRAT